MIIQLKVVGFLLVLLAAIHLAFPRYFNWRQEFASLSLINRQIMYVHTFFIALVILLMGILCLTSAVELLQTPLGKRLSLGLSIFWGTRLLIQFIGYSPALWRGKRFETFMHGLFAVLWGYVTLIFAMAYLWH